MEQQSINFFTEALWILQLCSSEVALIYRYCVITYSRAALWTYRYFFIFLCVVSSAHHMTCQVTPSVFQKHLGGFFLCADSVFPVVTHSSVQYWVFNLLDVHVVFLFFVGIGVVHQNASRKKSDQVAMLFLPLC